MNERSIEQGGEVNEMHHRQITLPDGRYMIFYTFGSEAEPVDTGEKEEDV